MENWYTEKLDDNARVLLSESGYTNTELALIYLDHLILHTGAATNKPPKVLLMDRHGSHMQDDFIIKATDHNIHPYPFPGHLTHILQPLDVGVFQPYKHWHKKAVQHAMHNLNIDYNVASFLRDLGEIHKETFKKGTIQGAFQKAGIWPINCDIAIEKMKIYAPPEVPEEPQLPTLPITPKCYSQAEQGLQYWKEKISGKLSSPSQQPFNSWACGTENMLSYGELTTLQLQLLSTKVANQQKAKSRSCNVLQKHGVLTGADARRMKMEKAAKIEAEKEKHRQYIERVARNKIRNELRAHGVLARRQERERKKKVQELEKANSFVPFDLHEPIPDPEKDTTNADIELQLQEALISTQQYNQYDISEAVLDPTLEADFISFEGLDNTKESAWNYEAIDADDAFDTGLF